MENEKFTPTMRGREQVVPIQEKFLITVPEAAKYFGIGTKQLRVWQKIISATLSSSWAIDISSADPGLKNM